MYYQKHMTHHLLPEVDRAALAPLRHAFLIRDPAVSCWPPTPGCAPPRPLDDLGIWQQAEIFDRFGGPVIDVTDLLDRPAAVLRALCAALGVPFSARMLSLAGRAAGHRRRLGAVLVRIGLAVHRVRPLPALRTRRCPHRWPRWPGSASRTTSGCTPAG